MSRGPSAQAGHSTHSQRESQHGSGQVHRTPQVFQSPTLVLGKAAAHHTPYLPTQGSERNMCLYFASRIQPIKLYQGT